MTADQDAVLTLWAAISPPNGDLPIRHGDGTAWFSVGEKTDYCDAIRQLAPTTNVLVGPARESRYGHVTEVSFLWTRVESRRSLALLPRLPVAPTMLLSDEGTVRVTAIWALTNPLQTAWADMANRRLAHFVRAPKKYANPEMFWFRPPGSMWDESRERPVRTAIRPDALYEPREVVGNLPNAPDPNAWKHQRKATA